MGREKCIQSFDQKTRRKDDTKKTRHRLKDIKMDLKEEISCTGYVGSEC